MIFFSVLYAMEAKEKSERTFPLIHTKFSGSFSFLTGISPEKIATVFIFMLRQKPEKQTDSFT